MPFDRVAALAVSVAVPVLALPVLALPVLAVALSAPAAAQNAADGERQYRARCASCHSTEAGQNRVGPHLVDIVGRAAGSVEGARYSAAMKDSSIVWDAEQLDAYLANPRQAVPGTSMPVGVPNAGQRAQIIDYLRTLSGSAR